VKIAALSLSTRGPQVIQMKLSPHACNQNDVSRSPACNASIKNAPEFMFRNALTINVALLCKTSAADAKAMMIAA
jgi:hypothetical protein